MATINWRRFSALPAWIGAAALVLGACTTAGAVSPDVVPPGSGMALKVPGGIAKLAVGECKRPGQIIITTGTGAHYQVTKSLQGIGLAPIENCPRMPPPVLAEMLEDGIVTRGSLTIARAWLAQPTRRYGHGILGDKVEAGQLRVNTEDGLKHVFTLDAGSVFEDLIPRVVDLEGDGQEEILVVRTRLTLGAATAVFGAEGGKLRLIAESDPIGQSNRWLNPVGVADFDGDGKREIAVVVTPHIGGSLIVYARKGGRLVQKFGSHGYSNHAIGSRELGMSTIVDFNEDGVPDMALPGAQRRSLRVVTFAGGNFKELTKLNYGAEIISAILPANFDTQIYPDLVFGLEDGTLVVLPR